MGELKAGDFVYDHNGIPTEVVDAFEPFDTTTYRVIFDSGIEVVCDEDHYWYVERPKYKMATTKRKAWCHGEVIKTSELIKRIESEPTFIPTSATDYPAKTLDIDPYWFGLWLGDGCKDYPIIYSADELPLPYKPSKVRKKAGCKAYYFGRQKLRQKLRNLGVIGGKHIPDVYKFGSLHQRYELIRGLMDSDGTISSSGTCRFDNSNEKLVDDFVEIVRSCGLKAFKHRYDKRGEFYVLFRAGATPICKLKRKQDKVFPCRQIRHKIVSIEEVGEQSVRCIKVASQKSLFLATKGYVATHNTVFSINETIDQGLRNVLKNPQYAYVAPTYGQAKRVAWDYVKQYTHMLPGYKANEAELTVRIYRPQHNDWVKFMLLGADNPDSHRGIYLDGLLLDEFAEMDPRAWSQVFRPALSDRMGWGIFIGTPKGQNHFYDVHQIALEEMSKGSDEWFTTTQRASETGIIPASELRAAKVSMAPEEYEQEYECSFTAALTGAYFGKQMQQAQVEGRITNVPFDRHVPVLTYWDLGMNDTTAIWFMQNVGREWHAVDYIERNGLDIPDYGKMLRERRDEFGYDYEEHVLPHDAKAKVFGSGGKTRHEMLRGQKIGRVRVLPKTDRNDGISAARVVISQVWFNQTKCKRGIEALKNYTKRFDSKNKCFLDEPLHNWASNGADGFRYFAVGRKAEPISRNLPRQADSGYDIFGGNGHGFFGY